MHHVGSAFGVALLLALLARPTPSAADADVTINTDRPAVTAPWDAFIEYAADFPERGGSRQLLHVGTSYKLTAHQQIDLHAAVGLSDAAPRSYVGVGDSILLLRGAP
jgi:hypothetical protein